MQNLDSKFLSLKDARSRTIPTTQSKRFKPHNAAVTHRRLAGDHRALALHFNIPLHHLHLFKSLLIIANKMRI